jgi:uncharacterized repeat protein (TIGR01451 family)
VFSSVDSQGVLSIESDAGDPIILSSVAGAVQVNGLAPGSGPAATSAIRNVQIVGGPGDNLIDLSEVAPAQFVNLSRIQLAGGAGVDSLATPSPRKTITLSGLDEGHISGPNLWPLTSFNFSSIENLEAGASGDTFAIEQGAGLSGMIEGGSGHDTINYEDFDTSVDVVLTGTGAHGYLGLATALGNGFQAIDHLEGSGLCDLLVGLDLDSVWTLEDSHSYLAGTAILSFAAFELLQGGIATDTFLLPGDGLGTITAAICAGDGDDAFVFGSTTLLIGSLDGESGLDTLDYSGFGSAIDAALDSMDLTGYSGSESTSLAGDGTFRGIDRVIGTQPSIGPDSLHGLPLPATWSLAGTSVYNTASNPLLEFAGFENLHGGSDADRFELLTPTITNLFGGAGDDTFHIPLDHHFVLDGFLDGQAGNDGLTYDGRALPVLVDLAAGAAASITRPIESIENITGGLGDDRLAGDAGDNLLGGGPGNDWLADGPGSDVVDGDLGDDSYTLHAGDTSLDTVIDPGGTDTLDFSLAGMGVTLDIDSFGVQVVAAGARLQLAGALERFIGSSFPDLLSARPLVQGRDFDGAAPTQLPGDLLILDALGLLPTQTSSTFVIPGFGLIDYTHWENVQVINAAGPTPAQSDLALTLAPLPPSIPLGSDVTYTYTITNLGPSTATDVVLICLPPGSTTFVSIVPSTGGSIAPLGTPTEIHFASLAPGATATVTLVVRPTMPGQHTSSGVVLAQTADPNPTNNAVFSTISLVAVFDLIVTLHASSDPALVGQSLVYTTTIFNRGPSASSAVSLIVDEQLVAGATASFRRFVVDVGSIDSGRSHSVSFEPHPSASGSLTITASATAQGSEPTMADNSATRRIAIVNPPDVAAPRVTHTTRTPLPRRPRRITLTFSEPMDAASVTDLRNYRLTTSGRDRRFDTADDRNIRPRRALYDPTTRTLTLAIGPRARWPRRLRLIVGGAGSPGIYDLAGNRLQPNEGLPPGSGFMVYFFRRRPAFTDTRPQRTGG